MSHVEGDDPNVITHRIRAADGQLTDIFVVETNDGVDVFKVDKDGYIVFSGPSFVLNILDEIGVSGFETAGDLFGITGDGTFNTAEYNSKGPGVRSLKLESTGGATVTATLTPDVGGEMDLSRRFLKFWIKQVDIANMSKIEVRFLVGSTDKYFTINVTETYNESYWRCMSAPKGSSEYVGGAVRRDWEHITAIQFVLVPNATNTCGLYLDDLTLVEHPNKGFVTFTGDDGGGYATALQAYQRYGIRFVLCVPIGNNSSAQALAEYAHLEEIGIDVIGHGDFHEYLQTSTPEQARAYTYSEKTKLWNNGCKKGSRFTAYPGGGYNNPSYPGEIIEVMRNIVLLARKTGGGSNTIPSPDPMTLNAIYVDTMSDNDLIGWIQKTVDYGEWLITYGHPGFPSDTVMQYMQDNEIPTITFSDAWDRLLHRLSGRHRLRFNDKGRTQDFPDVLINLHFHDILGTSTDHCMSATAGPTPITNYAVDAAYYYDDSEASFTDYTTEANNATEDDFEIMPIDPELGYDYHYVGYSGTFSKVGYLYKPATATKHTSGVWEYWDGDSWETITDMVDNSVNFTDVDAAADGGRGYVNIEFTPPGDWATTSVNGVTKYWIRFNLTGEWNQAGSAPTGTQIWIGGHPALPLEITSFTHPDYPRALSVTATNIDTPSGDIVITGTDIRGKAISETITLSPGNTVRGDKPFATISTLIIPATVTNLDTVELGITDKMGLNNELFIPLHIRSVIKNQVNLGVTTSYIDSEYWTYDFDSYTLIDGDDITIIIQKLLDWTR